MQRNMIINWIPNQFDFIVNNFHINISEDIPECEYGPWGDWSECSHSCGTGLQNQKRQQLSMKCTPTGEGISQNKMCNEGECPGK